MAKLLSLSVFCLVTFLIAPTLSTHASSNPVPERGPPIFLGVGEQRILTISGLKRFSIGRPVVRAVPLPWDDTETLMLKALEPGMTDLVVWKQDGTLEHRAISVHEWKDPERRPEIQQLMHPLQEVEAIIHPSKHGSKMILRGEIRTARELRAVRDLVAALGEDAANQTRINPHLRRTLHEELERVLNNLHLKDRTRIIDEETHISLVGNGLTPDEIRETRSALVSGDLPIDFLDSEKAGAPRTVFFRVYLFLANTQDLSRFGLQLPSRIGGLLSFNSGANFSLSDLELGFSQLASEGKLEVLSNPRIAVESGATAELFSGGQMPIRNQGRFFSNVDWKNYGLSLQLTAGQILGSELEVEVTTELSQLDQQLGSEEVPGIQSNKIKTKIRAQIGRPIFLCGLVQEVSRDQNQGTPGLRNVPILNWFTSEQSDQSTKTELMAVLVPHLAPFSLEGVDGFQDLPQGPIPPPRNWVHPQKMKELRDHPDFPWNVLK